MQCECGREIKNVPEHLQGLCKWQCKKCAKRAVIVTAPQASMFKKAPPPSFMSQVEE